MNDFIDFVGDFVQFIFLSALTLVIGLPVLCGALYVGAKVTAWLLGAQLP